jgi:radical SAM superfamily enzyme YgiQ (UPF0313 family)
MVDFLFVNPPSPDGSLIIRDLNRSGRTSREKIIWPQTSLALLAAMVDKKYNIEILDCIAHQINWEEFTRLIASKKPRYLISHVITSTSDNDFKAFRVAKEITNAVTISMGPHVTELTEESFDKCPWLDYIIVGEPEITFKELIEKLEKNETVEGVKGIAYHNNQGKVIKTEQRPFIKNLDVLPLPRYDLLPLEKYVYPFVTSKFVFIIPHRGCPYPCTFCRQPIMWHKEVRFRSPENIIEELKLLKSLGISNFLTLCDTFTINKDWTINLCKRIVEENIDVSWGCNSRVDTVDKETLYWLKKAGCWMIAYGIESGSQKVLDNCKKEITLKQITQAVQWTQEAGIKVYGYFIIGLMGETKETIKETINFAKKLPITFAIFHTASPYPGTEFYKQARAKGYLTEMKWDQIDQGSNTAINYPELTSEEIIKSIKKAYLSFYLRPKIIIDLLKELKNLSDLRHLLQMIKAHIIHWK